jgi:hypothetical protein
VPARSTTKWLRSTWSAGASTRRSPGQTDSSTFQLSSTSTTRSFAPAAVLSAGPLELCDELAHLYFHTLMQ